MNPQLIALVAAAAVLVVVSLATAKRPTAPVPDFDGYIARWRPLHDDYNPATSRFLYGWLRLGYAIAKPMARRGVLPDVLTIWSIWLAFAVCVPATAGGNWPILAGWTLAVSGLFDTLDGCVAVLTDKATRWGYVLDSVVDRICDVVYLFAVVSVGAPAALAYVAGGAFALMEYLRARAGNAGMGEIGVVTIGERGARVILCSAGILFGGVAPRFAGQIATLGLGLLALVSVVGLVQLVVVVRRALLADAPAV